MILNNILVVFWYEFCVMCICYFILLVFSGGIFVYGLFYNYMYVFNVVCDVLVVVVDMSCILLSCSYICLLDVILQVWVLINNVDLFVVKELMKYDEVVGIVYIFVDFDVCVGCGEEVIYIMYSIIMVFFYFVFMQEVFVGVMFVVNDDV